MGQVRREVDGSVLGVDVSDQPGEAYLITTDGEKVPCLLEEVGPRQWQATPVRDVRIDEVEQAYIDVLPGQSSVNFVIWGEEE